MNRMTDFALMGKSYPLNFSVIAARKVNEKFGGLENLSGILGWEDVSTALCNASWILGVLMEQGAAYSKLSGNAEVTPPSMEDLDVMIGASDLPRIQAAVLETIGLGMKPTVEVEPEKNADTTPDTAVQRGTTITEES